MNDYYSFDIEFPNVDFNNYYIKCDIVSKVHHAHLTTHENEIELKIFYDDNTYFGEKIAMWVQKINWRKFGSFIKVSNEKKKDRLKKIDLSLAKLCSIQNSTGNYDGITKFVVIKIDFVKFYWNPVKEELNTAEFYLHDVGFRVVKDFYSIVFGQDGNFNISRMNGMDVFYPLDKSEFRPEFNTISRDNRENRVATITKEPKIQFKYNKQVTEEEAIFYGDVVCLLASFYHHIKIDYSLRRIHLPEHTITIKKIEVKNHFETRGSLWSFNIFGNFHKFLHSDWQKNSIKNFKLLSKAIELFNQALLVDSNSEFLIRYNIIELCDTRKQSNEKFNLILTGNAKKKKYKEALKLLLETVNPKEHKPFRNKWDSLSGKLENKPMKSPLTSFLESQNIKTSDLPISVDVLKELRNNITHGSIDKVDAEILRRANTLLYRINGILILNLIGVKDWKLNTELN
ncbi:MAG: hypothetical protein Q8M15_11430 [Bacteroidota bacterium]|nr:hypothetical protein [Bacteroidota bacterium]